MTGETLPPEQDYRACRGGIGVVSWLSGACQNFLKLNLAAACWTSWPEVRWRIRLRGEEERTVVPFLEPI